MEDYPEIPAHVDITVQGPVRGGIPQGNQFYLQEFHLVHYRHRYGGVSMVVGLPTTSDPALVTCGACASELPILPVG